MNILFVDAVCPKPYDLNVCKTQGLGGSEASLLRMAYGLLNKGHNVNVVQHNREKNRYKVFDLNFVRMDHVGQLSSQDIVISQRNGFGRVLTEAKWPNAKQFIWCHDLMSDENIGMLLFANETKTPLICVSNWHKGQVQNVALNSGLNLKDLRVEYVHNPVSVTKAPNIQTDPNKLVFFSSPQKGLLHTLENFKELRDKHPRFKLYVANPGYHKETMDPNLLEGVVDLGVLPHHEVLKHVQEAFAVYHANFIFPETFGLVHAEANALGTPVLTHPHGANPEILGFKSPQLVQARDAEIFNARLIEWAEKGRPDVKADPRFDIQQIVKQWEQLFNEG